ncbi:4-hydroxythreonine-4-phosphate dehydrogenase PdxA [Aurantiacibacter gangjinensis]|uniref:4-hydroxythreonine-4-phosphate dehydrogenase n=1 Tax=Aurantiacibacter gangjinensis TaxID=502682 RepID=A0A0G9MVK9_9SPHN|nr:4-hydroxythreonine-4-phosphate dehydrogenase PdxA [Aurantiacibacter gangjinensis]APE26842.1 4-hydroxythreonine-4-phosphate dehydrogenase [Aurantiacibacter gangjinensis]KLE33318.1 4-hydroxythreonine-4-phosphate dehydrogenase [Aurantiacibacter gangjinensis]
MTSTLPLAVSIGDPAGVGPELIARIYAERKQLSLPPFAVCGGAAVLTAAAEKIGLPFQTERIADPREAQKVFAGALPVIGTFDGEYTPGTPTTAGAQLSLDSLHYAIALATGTRASGLVTAPVAKSAIAAIDPGFIGQTERLAEACDLPHEASVMMLAGPSLKTVPMTVHCALADVSGLLTRDLIVDRTRIVARAMRTDYGIAHPRIALAGLNPHAGEDGRMGREEIDIIAPAIAALRTEGIDATGPHPADTLFATHKRGSYDVAIAMYHDQALVPLKALEFDEGVNVTLGLPIVRTSPDHGTAFDIAGQGIARANAMIAAIRMAGEIAARRAQTS